MPISARRPLVLIAALCLLSAGEASRAADAAGSRAETGADRPNIVFILTDDQGPWATGATDPLDNAATPHMDRLFKQGARLKHMFTPTPVCSPSRATLMTSRYGTELGITDWLKEKTEPELGLDPALVTWPEVLNIHGYKTGLVGKWHLGTRDKYHPTSAGFDYFFGNRSGGWSPVDPKLEENGEYRKFKGLNADILADRAIDFIKRNREGPFLLCWHTRAPHKRWLPVSDADWAPYADPFEPKIPNPDYPNLQTGKVKRWTREYLASVRSVDRNMGRLLGTLDELGLRGNTVVIFCSDHGYNIGHHGVWSKGNAIYMLTKMPPGTENVAGRQRPNLFETSLRVPAAIRWPGVIDPNTAVEHTLTFLDFYPTLLDIAGIDEPENTIIRGRSFLPLLKGEKARNWDDDLYAQYSTHHSSRTAMRAWRTPRWKLVRDLRNPGRDELYDLENDPGETNNLIDSESPEVQRARSTLNEKLLDRMREIDDPALKLAK